MKDKSELTILVHRALMSGFSVFNITEVLYYHYHRNFSLNNENKENENTFHNAPFLTLGLAPNHLSQLWSFCQQRHCNACIAEAIMAEAVIFSSEDVSLAF